MLIFEGGTEYNYTSKPWLALGFCFPSGVPTFDFTHIMMVLAEIHLFQKPTTRECYIFFETLSAKKKPSDLITHINSQKVVKKDAFNAKDCSLGSVGIFSPPKSALNSGQ